MYVVYEVMFVNGGKEGVQYSRIREFGTLDDANEFITQQIQMENNINLDEHSYTIVMEP